MNMLIVRKTNKPSDYILVCFKLNGLELVYVLNLFNDHFNGRKNEARGGICTVAGDGMSLSTIH